MLEIFGADVKIAGEIKSPPGTVSLSVDLDSIPVGRALAQLVSWAQPGRTVTFDPPWDRLLDLTLPPVTFTFSSTPASDGKPVVSSFAVSAKHLGVDFQPFLTLDALSLRYTPEPKAVEFEITGSFLGQDFGEQPLSWDVLSSRPPAVPTATEKVFELRYLGLGQRIEVKPPKLLPGAANPTTPEARTPTLWDVIQNLEGAYEQVHSGRSPIGDKIDFAPNGGWLVGIDFTLVETVTVAALFNDPTMYGLHLAVRGPKAGRAGGLSFDILYRKVGENLGVYHAELVLPDLLRHIELGTVSITLPVIALDVYTNGDFLVDLGFPYQLDFSRSFAIQMLPFVGAGGFYFGLLSQQSATALPSPANGSFAPVVAFGLGLQVGVGKTVSYGPLSGGITVTVQGSIEGLIAGWRPGSGSDVAAVFYRISGQVSVSGHLYATIDFVIIKASVDVYAYVGVALVMESYRATPITLSAGVEISVSLKIVFFTIHLSFSATIEASFEVGSASTAPWDAAGANARIEAARRLRAIAPPTSVVWRSLDLVAAGARASKATVTVCFAPQVAFGEPLQQSDAPAAQVIAVCFMDAAMANASTDAPEADATSFAEISRALFGWAMQLAGGGTKTVTQAAVKTLFDELAKPEGDGGMPTDTLLQFLVDNVEFELVAVTTASQVDPEHVTVFPMLPWLQMSSSAAPAYAVDFAVHNPAPPEYRDELARYFAQLDPSTDGPTGALRVDAQGGDLASLPGSLAAVVMADWCKLVLRQLLGDALKRFGGLTCSPEPLDPNEQWLSWLAERYGLGADGLLQIALANQANAELRADYTISRCRAQPRERESPRTFCKRLGIGFTQLADAGVASQGLLAPTATVSVVGATYRITDADVSTRVIEHAGPPITYRTVLVATDLLATFAARFTVSAQDLMQANSLEPSQWTSAGPGPTPQPPPLKAGDVIALPALTTPAGDRTLARLAADYRVTGAELLEANADNDGLLSPLFTLTLPDFTHEAGDATPLQVAQRFGLTVAELIAANDTRAIEFGKVVIPDAAVMPIDELAAGVLSSDAVKSAAGTVARFLLHGLRLPAPEDAKLGESGALYGLTGQQFIAPAQPSGAEIVIQPTATPGLATPKIDFPDQNRLEVQLSSEAASLIEAYRALPSPPFDPEIIGATRYPPYSIVPRRYALGRPRPWQRAWPWPGGEGAALPKIYALPSALLADMAQTQEGKVAAVLSDPGVPGASPASATPIADARWALSADFLIRQVPGPGGPGNFVPSMYELVSSVGDVSLKLLALARWLQDDPSRSARIELLYSSSAQANDNSGMRSDGLAPETVALVKANLSTVTAKPSTTVQDAQDPPPRLVDATMNEPEFVQLLWECSTVNTGGYFLQYGPEASTRLPDILFEAAPLATLTVLAFLDEGGTGDPPPLRPFHNAVVTTVDSSTSKLSVDVEAYLTKLAATATTLAEAAAAFDVDVAAFAAANATNAALLEAGTHIVNPLLPGGRYVVQAGDDLLALAQLMKMRVEAAAQSLAASAALVAKGAPAWPQARWLARSSPLPAGIAGFRLTRTNPDPPSTLGDVRGQTGNQAVALATAYHLLSYRVAASDGFIASNDAMPLAPVSPGSDSGDRKQRNVPWRYQQILPVATLIPGASSRYAAVGRTATLQFALQDLYGNRALAPHTPADLAIPVYYDDALLPLASWPKARISYTAGGADSGELQLTLRLDASSTVATASSDPAAVASRADDDAPRYTLAGDQLDRPDVTVSASSSLAAGEQQLQSTPLLAFTSAAHDYFEALSKAKPLRVDSAGKTLGEVADQAGTTPADLGTANQDADELFLHGTPLVLPLMAAAILGDSPLSIAARFKGSAPELLGTWNADVGLAPDIEITLGTVKYKTRPGDTLGSLAKGLHEDAGKLSKDNATVIGLFAQGTTLVVATSERTYEGDSLRVLAAAAGASVSTFAQLNARAPLAPAAKPVVPGRLDTSLVSGPPSAIHRVAGRETLASIAHVTGAAEADLIAANAWNDGLLAVPDDPSKRTKLTYKGVEVTVQAGYTMQTVVARFAAHGVVTDAATLFMVVGNDPPGMLSEGAVMVVAPAEVGFTMTIAPSLTDGPVAPLSVSTTIRRTANVDPDLVDEPGVMAASSPVAAELDGTDPRSIATFATGFEAAFAPWKLALATSAEAGTSAAPGPGFYVVQITPDWDGTGEPLGIAYQFEQEHAPFAVPPVAQQPWSADRVPVAPYVSGVGLGADVATRVSATDLDAIQRRAVVDLDRFLEPGSALAGYAYAPQSVRDVVNAKFSLAGSVSRTLLPVLEGGWQGDPAVAKEAVRQLMLAQASQAYTTDAFVQVRARVRTPDAMQLRARLNGTPVSVSPPVPAVGVERLGGCGRLRHWTAAAQDHLGLLFAALGGDRAQEADRELFAMLNQAQQLEPGQQVTVGRRSHAVMPGESLADVAAALRVKPVTLVTEAPDALALAGSSWSLVVDEPPPTLTPAKLDLVQGETVLTFAVRTASLRQHRSIAPDLVYRPTELEYGIEEVEGGYESSRWLSFITARAECKLGQPTIPLPLRVFPATPRIVSQTATQLHPEPDWEWLGDGSFDFTYDYTPADQDEVTLRIERTHGGVGALGRTEAYEQLAIALIRYQAVADMLWADLAPLTSAAGAPDSGLRERCTAATIVFAGLIRAIAQAWAAWVADDAQATTAPASVRSTAGQRVTTVLRPDGRRRTTLHPAITGERGLRLTGGRRLPNGAEQVLSEPDEQSVALEPWGFVVPTDQQLWGIVDVIRNANLVDKRTTTGAFIYRLLNTRASAPALPLVRYTDNLDLRRVTPRPYRRQRTIDHVRNMFAAALLVTPGEGMLTCFVSVTSAWEFGFGRTAPIDAGDIHTVPAPAYTSYTRLFDPRVDFGESSGYSFELAEKLLDWQKRNEPPTVAAQWCLSLTVHAISLPAMTPGVPLLEVQRIILPLSAIKDRAPVD